MKYICIKSLQFKWGKSKSKEEWEAKSKKIKKGTIVKVAEPISPNIHAVPIRLETGEILSLPYMLFRKGFIKVQETTSLKEDIL